MSFGARGFLAGLLSVFCLVAFLPRGLAAGSPSAPPTLVLILTDDQRYDTLQYMPILRRELVGQGVTFANGFVTTPLCCPSRASILTGQYAHNTGIVTNGPGSQPWEGRMFLEGSKSNLAIWLQAAGYRTGLFGKYLNSYSLLSPRVPSGWDVWNATVSAGYFHYSINENGSLRRYGGRSPTTVRVRAWLRRLIRGFGADVYLTDVLARKAVDFIERGGDAPLFVYFAPFAPHWPSVPHPRDARLFPDLPPWRPPSYNEQDVSDKPRWIRRLPLLAPPLQAQGDALRKDQLRALQAVDRAIGQLIDSLRRTGRLANSVILFTSDNGLSWGEHRRLNEKGCPYEECLRVPFVLRGPGIPAGRVDTHLVLNIDIAPTLADLAGAPRDAPVDGRSLLPLFGGGAVPWRGEFLAERWLEAETTWTAIRTDRLKYVEYANGERELYDLVADPWEMRNLVADPRWATVIGELRPRLDALRRTGR